MMKNQKRYTPQQLADLINSSKEFLKTDLTYHTEWDMDYLYGVFSFIVSDKKADYIQQWMLIKWKQEHNYFANFSINCNLVEQYQAFEKDLSKVRQVVREKREEERMALELQMQLELLDENETRTPISPFSDIDVSNTENYHINDLPTEVRKIVLLKDDKTYTCLVKDLRGPVKKWIDKHNLKDWNVVKVAMMTCQIIARKTPVVVFDKLLMHVFPGMASQKENMKKRTDCNKDNVNEYMNNIKFWKLKADVDEVKECLANTLEMMLA